MDSDRIPSILDDLGAFLSGADDQSSLRRDGARVSLERASSTLRWGVHVRDELESPLATVTSWDLFGNPLSRPDNLAATTGDVRELAGLVTWRPPWVPLTAEAGLRTAPDGIGGAFHYTRMRAALASDLPIGRIATAVPQATLGRLEGDATPQNAFYLGGPQSLRSLPSNSEGGQRKAFARFEVIGAPDLLEALHIPHPAMLNLSLGAQAAIGAVWGADPYGGPPRSGEAWPGREAWKSEAGFSFMYRSGLPDPNSYLRIDYARGLGPRSDVSRWSAAISTAFDQLRPLAR